MFVVNEDNSIFATRGDVVVFSVSAVNDDGSAFMFTPGDVVRINIHGKKDCENVYLAKNFIVTSETETVEILLYNDDLKFGESLNKPKEYWYEIELNPDTDPQTIIGYDEDGPKIFKLYPEGGDIN